MQTAYKPLLKKKGFDPSPVAGRIPNWADSVSNPKCVETTAFKDFWDEQIDRCINGYITAGVDIPGRYYYYLNFMPLKGLMGGMYPMYVDIDLEYFKLIEYVKENHKMGIISPKARRKGLSEKGKTILSHGIRFIPGYRGAITAGLETYVTGLRKKFEHGENAVRKEYRLNNIQDNEKVFQLGYHIKDPIGGFIEDGFGGMLSFETMYDDPSKLEGEYFHDVICEESGQYKLLGEVIESIKPALMFGSQMMGTFLIYGTGGNILSTSKDFKDLWDNSDTYDLERFWVPGTRLFHPFFGNKLFTKLKDPDDPSVIIDAIPNLRKHKPHQIIGCEDIKAAEEFILRKRVEYAKLPNKKKLKKHNQSYPLTVEEAFTSGGSNNFNDELIYEKLFEIEGKIGNYKEVVLDWVRDEEAGEENDYKRLEVRPAKKNDAEWKRVWVLQEPRKDMVDLDVAGVDSYNQDQTRTSSSLGAMIVVRQGNRVNMVDQGIRKSEYPVCLYYARPPRKEMFYEMCLKIAIWYGLKRNVMCSAEQDFVIDYFTKNNGTRYLAPRPKTFDSKKTQQVHKYGAKILGSNKEIILGLVQSMIEDYVHDFEFPALLRDALAYDEEYIGTDWDSVDALAYAKMRIEDMRTRPRRSSDEEEITEPVKWVEDSRGNMICVRTDIQEDKKDVHTREERGGWRPGFTY